MRKLLCIILIASLLSYSICIYAQNNGEVIQDNQTEEVSREENKNLEQLQAEAEEINKQITENSEKLELVEGELTQSLIQVQEIDSKIQISEQELNELNNEVLKLNENIKNKEEELEIKQQYYLELNKRAEEALVSMYEAGNMQYLDVLLGSKSIVDFISNYFLISELLEYNMNLVEGAARQKQEVEEIVQDLEKQKEEIIAKKKEQQKISQVLSNTKTSREYYMAKLTEEEMQLQTQIEEYKMQMAKVEIEIRKLSMAQSFGEDYIGGEMIWPPPAKSGPGIS